MKKIYLFISLLLVLCMVITSCLKNPRPETVDEKLATKIAWLLIKDKFTPSDFLETYLKAERKGSDWHVGLDYEQIVLDKVPYDDQPDYKVVIQGKDGKIKSVTSLHGEIKKYTRKLVDKQLALQIAEVLANTSNYSIKDQDIIYSIEKNRLNWHVSIESKDKVANSNFDVIINSENGKIDMK